MKDIIYCVRILFPKSQIPYSSKYIQWATDINLIADNHICEPFNFKAISDTQRTYSKFQKNYWIKFYKFCLSNNLMPPEIGSQFSNMPRPKTNHLKNGKIKFNCLPVFIRNRKQEL